MAQALDVGLSTIHRVGPQFVEERVEAALTPRRPMARPANVNIKGEVEQH